MMLIAKMFKMTSIIRSIIIHGQVIKKFPGMRAYEISLMPKKGVGRLPTFLKNDRELNNNIEILMDLPKPGHR